LVVIIIYATTPKSTVHEALPCDERIKFHHEPDGVIIQRRIDDILRIKNLQDG
jgi:hypothetical protein